jgi:hypothetical protein
MGEWLQFHIFTGIVGPFLVLLHSAWSFRGLAGIVTLMMLIVVVSGFIGRYIYTAVPRTPEGVLLEAEDLARLIAEAEAALKEVAGEPVAGPEASSRGITLILGRRPGEILAAWRRWRALRRLDPAAREAAERVLRLQARLAELRRQVASLATARRLLATWHTIHIPLGMALFVAAFYHIGAGLYFATLQR